MFSNRIRVPCIFDATFKVNRKISISFQGRFIPTVAENTLPRHNSILRWPVKIKCKKMRV